MPLVTNPWLLPFISLKISDSSASLSLDGSTNIIQQKKKHINLQLLYFYEAVDQTDRSNTCSVGICDFLAGKSYGAKMEALTWLFDGIS